MKYEDGRLHIFTPSGWWGDQILNFYAIKYCLEKYEKSKVIIHASKRAYNPHLKEFIPMDQGILKFWSTFNFVEGILFDCDQETLYEDAEESNYKWFPFLNEKVPDDYNIDLSKEINFSLFPKRFKKFEDSKIAVFQPISLKNKPDNLKRDFLCSWDQSFQELIKKKYSIYLIGSVEDLNQCEIFYPELLKSNNIINLMGKINMFEAIDLVMNHASFVLSCCSWSAWYGIASRTPTAFAAGPILESGHDNKYVKLIKNKDIFYMDYSSKKEEADSNIQEWIINNA